MCFWHDSPRRKRLRRLGASRSTCIAETLGKPYEETRRIAYLVDASTGWLRTDVKEHADLGICQLRLTLSVDI